MERQGWNRAKSTIKGWKRPLIITTVLILFMSVGSFVLVKSVSSSEEDQAITRLEEETASLVDSIYSQMEDDCGQLEILATLISTMDDPTAPEIRETLASYNDIGTIDHLELLLPDNTIVTSHGDQVAAPESMRFAELAAQGAHIGTRERDVAEPGEFVVRNWMPVVRDGETVGMLCGVIALGTMPESLMTAPYDGHAAIYIIEAKTGDFLVDTWHPGETGNIWALGARPMAKGFNHEQLKQDLTDGKSGYVVFTSNTTGENLYFCFQPSGINDWQVALSVPESTVFARASSIRSVMNIFLLFESGCFVIYFFAVLRHVRYETGVKQRQLDTINYIYEVEKLLFSAHVNQTSLATALERIAQITSAECVSLWFVEDGEPSALFSRTRSGFQAFDPLEQALDRPGAGARQTAELEEKRAGARSLIKLFQQGYRTVDVQDRAELERLLPSGLSRDTSNLIAVPIEESDGTLEGILTARNAGDIDLEISLLQNVEPSFAMFRRNLRAFHTIKERSEVDMMTGLLNRNRFEADMPSWAQHATESLTCIYLDANGLHELNNTEGHQAGDRMLQAVARTLQERFGCEGAYRIGGDEFVVIVCDTTPEEAERCLHEAERALAQQGIRISAGMARHEAPVDVEQLIKEAEGLMFQAKRAFYQQAGNDRRGRRS